MRKFFSIILLAVSFALILSSPAIADEKPVSDFFGIKKFTKKGIPANPPKKKVKGIPAQKDGRGSNDTELTDEEKKMVSDITAKAPEGPRKNIKLPSSALAAPAPRPPVTAPRLPITAPKNPNAEIIHIPKAPSRINQSPSTSGPASPSSKKS